MNAIPEVVRRLEESDYKLAPSHLRSIQIEVSSACNLRCPQCFNRMPSHVTGLLDIGLWNARIKPFLKQFASVHLVGIGEPLTNPHFFTYVADALNAGAQIHTTSNLQLARPVIAERFVTSGIASLSFSCDGATKETYKSIRVRGSLERLERALTDINEAKARLNSKTPTLTLNFGASKRNIAELPAVVELAARHGVNTLIAYHNVAYLEEMKEESMFHDKATSDKYFSLASASCKKAGISFLSPSLFENPIKYSAGPIYCGYPFSHLYIYSDGRVGPCCMDFPDRIILGSLKDSSLPEIWNGPSIRNLRRQMCAQPSETCQFCVSHLKMDISDPRHLFRFPGSDKYVSEL